MVTSDAMASGIQVRSAVESDSRLIFSWRNDAVTREMSHTSDPIPWEDHKAWFERTLKDPSRWLLMCSTAERRIAVTRFDLLEHKALVSINLDPDVRGQGLGKASLRAAIDYFNSMQSRPLDLLAEIKCNNLASRRSFEVCDFFLEREDEANTYYRWSMRN